MKNLTDDPIDLVYLWCDGSEPVIREKRERRAKELGIALGGKDNGACRYRNNDEFLFALRSVCRFAPWIRNVYLVMDDDQTPPGWLNLNNPRLRIVRHSEILPAESLPCFNSTTIEFGIPRIVGLSEKFLYANDDMYFARPTEPSFFFAPDGLPICRYVRSRNYLEEKKDASAYERSLCNNARFIREKVLATTPVARIPPSLGRAPHHNVDAYLKSTCLEFAKRYVDDLRCTMKYSFRDGRQLQREVWSSYALAINAAHFRLTKRPWYEYVFTGCRHESLCVKIGEEFLRRFKRIRPFLFCFNDNPDATQEDRDNVYDFLESLFPDASEFEKIA